MNTTTRHRTTLRIALSTLFSVLLLGACGETPSGGVVTDLPQPAANDIVEDASRYIGDPMEQRAREEYWRRYQQGSLRLHDSWEQRLLEQHEQDLLNAPSAYEGDPWERRLREQHDSR